MYKLGRVKTVPFLRGTGLAAFLVLVEFVLARLTHLDMSRFLAWRADFCFSGKKNLIPLCQPQTGNGSRGQVFSAHSSYEELLAEFSTVDTPFSKSPPYIQLMILVAFNTAIFVGSALIQKAFQVDILPIVCSMTGANPLEATQTQTAAKPAAAKPGASPFAAFTRNFTGDQ